MCSRSGTRPWSSRMCGSSAVSATAPRRSQRNRLPRRRWSTAALEAIRYSQGSTRWPFVRLANAAYALVKVSWVTSSAISGSARKRKRKV